MRCVQAWFLLRENLSHAPLSAPGGHQQSLAFVAYRDICSVSASVFSVSRPCVSSLLLIRTPVITGHPNPERPHFNLVTAPKTLFSQIRSHSGGPSEHEFSEGVRDKGQKGEQRQLAKYQKSSSQTDLPPHTHTQLFKYILTTHKVPLGRNIWN